jgi:arsenate-mycothiol transferase
MAAAILRSVAGPRVDVHSAGTHPDDYVHGESATAVAEIGADMAYEVPHPIDPEILRTADRVIVLGSEAEVSPVDGMRAAIERWIIVEPADDGVTGLPRTRLIRDDIARRVQFLAEQILAGSR